MARKALVFSLLVLLPAQIGFAQTARPTPPVNLKPIFADFDQVVYQAKKKDTKKTVSSKTAKKNTAKATRVLKGAPVRKRPKGGTLEFRLFSGAGIPIRIGSSASKATKATKVSKPPKPRKLPPAQITITRPPAAAQCVDLALPAHPGVMQQPTVKLYNAGPNPWHHHHSHPTPQPARQWTPVRERPLVTWAPTRVSQPYAGYSFVARSRTHNKREAAIAHLNAAMQLLKGTKDQEAVRSLQSMITAQRTLITREAIAKKQEQIHRLQAEIQSLARSLAPKSKQQIHIVMTLASVDMDKVKKLGIDLPKCCVDGACRSHTIDAKAGAAFNKKLRELQKRGVVKILSRPQIMTTDQHAARIELASLDANGKPVVNKIKVHPRVMKSHPQQVMLSLEVTSQGPIQKGVVLPAPVRSVHTAKLACTVESGKTAIVSRRLSSGPYTKLGPGLLITIRPTVMTNTKLPPVPVRVLHRLRATHPLPKDPRYREAKKPRVINKKKSEVEERLLRK